MDWGALPEVGLGASAETVEVRVFNSGVEDFDSSKNRLKAGWFRFRGGSGRYWWRLIADSDFKAAQMLQTPWAQHLGVRIEAWRDGKCIFTPTQAGGRQTWAPF